MMLILPLRKLWVIRCNCTREQRFESSLFFGTIGAYARIELDSGTYIVEPLLNRALEP